MHVIFDGSTLSLANFGHEPGIQAGNGMISHFQPQEYHQRGWGYGQFPYLARQRGAGVGSVLKNIWRYLKPLAASVHPIASTFAREIGKEGLAATARTLGEVAKGEDLKEALGNQVKQSTQTLLEKAQNKLKGGGRGGQIGKGRGKRSIANRKANRRRKASVIIKPDYTVPGRALIKKRRVDSLGYY
jgi:NAD/NADP transhydrogenase alpha subunit